MGPRRPSGSRSCPHGFLVGRPIIIARVALGKRVVPELPGRRPPDGPAGAALTHERGRGPAGRPPPLRPGPPPRGGAQGLAAGMGAAARPTAESSILLRRARPER